MIFVIDQTVSRAPRQGSLSCCRKVVCTRRLQREEPGHLRWACHAGRADCEAPIRRLGRSRSRVAVTLRHNSSLLPACWIRRSARRSEQEAGPPEGAAVSPEPGRRESRGGRSLPRRLRSAVADRRRLARAVRCGAGSPRSHHAASSRLAYDRRIVGRRQADAALERKASRYGALDALLVIAVLSNSVYGRRHRLRGSAVRRADRAVAGRGAAAAVVAPPHLAPWLAAPGLTKPAGIRQPA